MRTLFFFLLLTFSISAFCYPEYEQHPEFFENFLVGEDSDCFSLLSYSPPVNPLGNVNFTKYYYLNDDEKVNESGELYSTFYVPPLLPFSDCHAVGWVSVAKQAPVNGCTGYDVCPEFPPISLGDVSFTERCNKNEKPFFFRFSRTDYDSRVSVRMQSSTCVLDCDSLGMRPEDCGCPNKTVYYFDKDYYLAFCPIEANFIYLSQKTLIKTNDLISESNSKFGLISGGTAAQTGLLSEILNTFRSLLTKTAGLFGTGDFAGNSEEDNSFIDFINRDSSRNVAAIQPLVSSSGSCPSPVSVSFFGRSSEFSYQPTCDFATRIRPIVVNAARVAAAWILIGAAL